MLPIRTTSSVPKDSLAGENKTPDCHTYAHAQYKIGNQFIEDILENKKVKSNETYSEKVRLARYLVHLRKLTRKCAFMTLYPFVFLNLHLKQEQNFRIAKP